MKLIFSLDIWFTGFKTFVVTVTNSLEFSSDYTTLKRNYLETRQVK